MGYGKKLQKTVQSSKIRKLGFFQHPLVPSPSIEVVTTATSRLQPSHSRSRHAPRLSFEAKSTRLRTWIIHERMSIEVRHMGVYGHENNATEGTLRMHTHRPASTPFCFTPPSILPPSPQSLQPRCSRPLSTSHPSIISTLRTARRGRSIVSAVALSHSRAGRWIHLLPSFPNQPMCPPPRVTTTITHLLSVAYVGTCCTMGSSSELTARNGMRTSPRTRCVEPCV